MLIEFLSPGSIAVVGRKRCSSQRWNTRLSTTIAAKAGTPSTRAERSSGSRTPCARRAPALQNQTISPKAAIGNSAVHLVPTARPQQSPLASSQGRTSMARTGPQALSSVIGAAIRLSRRARYQSRSMTMQETAISMNRAMKMSSRAILDSTKCMPSTVINSPATAPSNRDPVRRSARRIITSTINDPATTAAIRQPTGSIPKAFSPKAMSHLPTSGCTIRDGSSVHRPRVVPSRICSLASST